MPNETPELMPCPFCDTRADRHEEMQAHLCALVEENERLKKLEGSFGMKVSIEQAARIATLEAALKSIADNSCCGPCREAGLVAKAALSKGADRER